jgi:hypothetical protein
MNRDASFQQLPFCAISRSILGARGGAVVVALRYKPEGSIPDGVIKTFD